MRSPSHLTRWLICCVLALAAPGAVAGASSAFDHYSTGYELLGQHRDASCEACHVGGLFKGTPHDCMSCHSTGSRVGATAKPANHILSGPDCGACHTPFAWKPVASFTHLAVIGSCSSCHNGVQSQGKPAGHVPTTLECSACHVPNLPWRGARFTHAGITGNCQSCHDGQRAPGPVSGHLPLSGQDCLTCHASTGFTSWRGGVMSHAGITSGCQRCHETGMRWSGVSMVDRPTAAQDAFHPVAAKAPDCASCHSGFAAGDFSNVRSKPANHIPTTATCSQCHTTAGDYAHYVGGAPLHAGIASNCALCHGAGTGPFAGVAGFAVRQPPPNHMPIGTLACESCHAPSNFQAFGPGTAMNHAGITSGCQSCHESGMSWLGVTMVDRPTPAQDPAHPSAAQSPDCSTCHTGFNVGDFTKYAKPANHLPTSAPCAQCHTAIPNWAIYVMGATGHQGISTGCASCHASGLSFFNMAPPTLKEPPANHLPIGTLACESCHSPSNFVAFGPGTGMNHAGITKSCQTCHETGMGWLGVTMVDRPTAAQDAFHPTAASAPDCASCHTGFAVGDFNKVTTKPATHIPTNAPCAQCHTTPGNFALYTGGATLHTGIASNCALCHAAGTGPFAGAPGFVVKQPPANHLPIGGRACESCHSPATFTAFGPGTTMNHAGVASGCQSCHETGMTWFGVTMVDRPTKAQDANHPSAATGPDCASCHTGFAVGDFNKVGTKPANHIPTTAACGQCHTIPGNYTVYTGGPTLHAGITANCMQCHGAGAGPFAGVAGFTVKQPPSNHLPTTSAPCEGCHVPSTFLSFAGGKIHHASVPVPPYACINCHELGMANKWYGVTIVTRPGAGHHAGQDCGGGCHQPSDSGGGFRGNAVSPATPKVTAKVPARAAATLAAATPGVVPEGHGMAGSPPCASCHNGSSAAGKGVQHPKSTNACGTCHASVSWRGALRVDHAELLAACASCHVAGRAAGKPLHHPLSGNDCERCHTTSAWSPAAFDHSAVLPATCQLCHDGSHAVGRPAGHAATVASCDSCHYVLAWHPVRPKGAERTPTSVPRPAPRPRSPGLTVPHP
jgi:hypothetical protein